MTSIKFKPILTWMVRTGFCGEVGEEKVSGYQGKKAFVIHSERERGLRGWAGELLAINGFRSWPILWVP